MAQATGSLFGNLMVAGVVLFAVFVVILIFLKVRFSVILSMGGLFIVGLSYIGGYMPSWASALVLIITGFLIAYYLRTL
jgi:hypothetical protein